MKVSQCSSAKWKEKRGRQLQGTHQGSLLIVATRHPPQQPKQITLQHGSTIHEMIYYRVNTTLRPQ